MLTFLDVVWTVLSILGTVAFAFEVGASSAIVGGLAAFVIGVIALNWFFTPTPYMHHAAIATATNSLIPHTLIWGVLWVIACVIFFAVWTVARGILESLVITPILFILGAVVIQHVAKSPLI